MLEFIIWNKVMEWDLGSKYFLQDCMVDYSIDSDHCHLQTGTTVKLVVPEHLFLEASRCPAVMFAHPTNHQHLLLHDPVLGLCDGLSSAAPPRSRFNHRCIYLFWRMSLLSTLPMVDHTQSLLCRWLWFISWELPRVTADGHEIAESRRLPKLSLSHQHSASSAPEFTTHSSVD